MRQAECTLLYFLNDFNMLHNLTFVLKLIPKHESKTFIWPASKFHLVTLFNFCISICNKDIRLKANSMNSSGPNKTLIDMWGEPTVKRNFNPAFRNCTAIYSKFSSYDRIFCPLPRTSTTLPSSVSSGNFSEKTLLCSD